MQGPDPERDALPRHELHAQSSRGAAPQGRALLRAPRLPGVRLSDDEVAPARPVRTELTADQTLELLSTLAGVERPSSRERRRPATASPDIVDATELHSRRLNIEQRTDGCDPAGPRAPGLPDTRGRHNGGK